MPTAEELVIEIQSTGVSETKDKLEGVEDSMEETAEQAGDSAEELDGFSEKFAGAMQAAVAALAVGTAGLASQVPVVGELFAGLMAIMEAIGLQIDSLLRQLGLSGLAGVFFTVSRMILEADGALGDFIGVLGTLLTILGTVIVPIAALASQLGYAASTTGALVTGAKLLGGALLSLVGIPALIVAGIGALVAIIATDFLGIRTKAINAIKGLIEWFTNLGSNIASAAGDLASVGAEIASEIAEGFTGLSEDIIDALSGFLDYITGTGDDSLLGDIQSGFDGVLNWITNDLPGLFEDAWAGLMAGIEIGVGIANVIIEGINQALPNEFSIPIPRVDIPYGPTIGGGEITADLPDNPIPALQTGGFIEDEGLAFLHAGEEVVPSAEVDRDRTGSGGGRVVSGRMDSERGGMTLDGRQLSESTGRYRADPSRRRGL